jgi:hypothetical protein
MWKCRTYPSRIGIWQSPRLIQMQYYSTSTLIEPLNIFYDVQVRLSDVLRHKAGFVSLCLNSVLTLDTARVIGRPHPSRDFVELLGLEEIATNVRRVDPISGEKINKIRKSYEGKIKDLKVAGRNKAISTAKEFNDLMYAPDDHFISTNVLGKEMSKSIGADFQEKMKRALDIIPGSLPKSEIAKWKNVLAMDEGQPQVPGKVRPVGPGAGAAPEPTSAPTSAPALERPDRLNKKRKYTDNSFSGYNGFDDEEDTEDDGTKRKRKKVS